MISGLWRDTSQPLKERHPTLPLGIYEDGQARIALPGLIAGPAQATKRLMDSDMPALDDDAGWDQMSRDSFDAAGLAMTGAVGAGLAGGLADDAARGVRTYRGAASDRITPSTGENPGTVWSSTSPKVADFYAERAAGYADNDGLVMPLDVRGNYKTEGPWFGSQQWSPEWQAKIDAATADGYDGVRFRNVSDSIDGVTSDWFASASPGTVRSATTGDLLYSNAPTGAAVPMGMEASQGDEIDIEAILAELLRGRK
jgi:hypothetical protein